MQKNVTLSFLPLEFFPFELHRTLTLSDMQICFQTREERK